MVVGVRDNLTSLPLMVTFYDLSISLCITRIKPLFVTILFSLIATESFFFRKNVLLLADVKDNVNIWSNF